MRDCVEESPLAALALAFVVGQGVVGLLWLVVSLAGVLVPAAVWGFLAVGALCAVVFGGPLIGLLRRPGAAERQEDRFYEWIRRGITALLILRGVDALLPTKNDDALLMYLVTPRMVAATHVLEFQPYVMQHGLLPLQVEMHWAALFAISNETAVTLWDYLCSVGTLAVLAALGRRHGLGSRAVGILTLMMLTTPGFTLLMGAGKPDNAATQFGLAAFLWLEWTGWGAGRAAFWSGACAGWSMASRYTSFMLIPAWLWRLRQEPKLFWAHAGLGLALAWAPMLLKNWLLVGYPLAPLVGDPSSLWFWRVGESARNLSWTDVAFYPFVWTFGDRPMMLGNLSPLFLGLAVPWLLLRRHPDVWRVRGVLALGVSIVATWVAVEPRALHTRYLLVGVGVMAVGLAPAFVALDDRLGSARGLRLAGRTGLMALVGFWVLVSSWTALEAGRYAAGLGRREDRYRRKDGADVAEWLNQHVARGERVSLLGYGQYRYLLRTDILESSETREELEKAWVAIRSEPQAKVVARLAMDRGFRHVVGRRDAAGSLAAELPAGSEIAFGGAQYVVMTLPR